MKVSASILIVKPPIIAESISGKTTQSVRLAPERVRDGLAVGLSCFGIELTASGQ